ncbi:hypothetical protein HYDPIDRAFT_28160 [Hydnomerulius pinastri MD-312]|uniref:Calcium uniporter protein, mitochondrial n=1 Tax=Hydnomerulius pinastri MD-312 TaxID=994086 RepID=A0A0C9VGT6_9AGAM|nr:hypothetical protein HYDPIDRAFT_28160 [Hydnomerulius pinastri MD-312]
MLVRSLRFQHYPPQRCFSTPSRKDNLYVDHAEFLADAAPGTKWGKETFSEESNFHNGFESLINGKGKLSPTSSHLFKLILPTWKLSAKDPKANKDSTSLPPPLVMLLHPSQPLSHVANLIASSLAPDDPAISFQSTSHTGQRFQWSDSTDIGDFIKDAARAAEFTVHFTFDKGSPTNNEKVLHVEVPTFADRTRFLRRRLEMVGRELESMQKVKSVCDREARKGARRLAVGGFGMLVVYWGAVARLTFWDYGWDVMEPITYLSGLSTVICGYLWFLYHGRQVSYSSVLDHSISARREALYASKGLDIDRWMDLVSEQKRLRREIRTIAEDYDERRPTRESREKDDDDGEDGSHGEAGADRATLKD